MNRFKRFIIEIHHRSLWQVLLIYIGAAWFCFEIIDSITDRFGLPAWLPALAAILFLLGLPFVVATAFVREDMAPLAEKVGEAEVREGGTAPARRAAWRRSRFLTLRNAAAAFVVALALWGVAATGWLMFGEGSVAGPTQDKSIAVLPFVNLSGEEANEAFTNGFHDVVLTHLYKIAGLRPISRTSVMEYRNTTKNLRQIASELGVATILEGGVQRAGDQILVNVQLIDATSDEHIWAEAYDRQLTLENIFAIQQEIARHVASSLQVALSGEEERRLSNQPTDVPQAYDHYITGTEYLRRGSQQDLQVAEEELERAVELDPGFALAHASLAQTLLSTLLTPNPELRTAERLARAGEAAERALTLDDGLAEAHLAMGRYVLEDAQDDERAERHFRTAQRLNPGDGYVYELLGVLARRRGRVEEAITFLERAAELAPRDHSTWYDLAGTYCMLGRFSEANASYDRAIALAPDRVTSYYWKALCLLNQSRARERVWETVQRMREKTGHVSGGFFAGDRYRNRAVLRILPEEYQVFRGKHLREHSLESSGLYDVDYFLAKALYFDMTGEAGLRRAHFDSARIVLEEYVEAEPNEPYNHENLGIAYAGLGRAEDAVREGLAAVELQPISQHAARGDDHLAALAEIYIMVGEYGEAIDQLELLVSQPSSYKPALLRLDPVWAPLWEEPRFQAMLAKYDIDR